MKLRDAKPTLVIIFFAITAGFFGIGTALAETPQIVKIGLIYPLSGPMSSFGEDMAKAIPLLEKRFNANCDGCYLKTTYSECH